MIAKAHSLSWFLGKPGAGRNATQAREANAQASKIAEKLQKFNFTGRTLHNFREYLELSLPYFT